MTGGALPAATRLAEVGLTVRDLRRAVDFYEGPLGLAVLDEARGSITLGAGAVGFLRLVEDPGARPAADAARLYHFAILYPSRGELARAVRRVVAAGWPLRGTSDHLVSEAVYLSDPEGNGIELYRDRPREEWRWTRGRLEMATLPLGLERLLGEEPGGEPPAPAGTTIGHVHLQVPDLARAEAFYRHVIGFRLTTRYGSSASFLAAGDYHHHLGINTWGTAGARRAREGDLGLHSYRLVLPRAGDLESLEGRLAAAGVPWERTGGNALVRDPAGHRLVVGVG